MDMYCVPALAVLISFLGSDSLIAVVSVYPELQWEKKKKATFWQGTTHAIELYNSDQ